MKTLLAAAGAITFFAGLIGLIVEYNHSVFLLIVGFMLFFWNPKY